MPGYVVALQRGNDYMIRFVGAESPDEAAALARADSPEAVVEVMSSLVSEIFTRMDTGRTQLVGEIAKLKDEMGQIPRADDPMSVVRMRLARGDTTADEAKALKRALKELDEEVTGA